MVLKWVLEKSTWLYRAIFVNQRLVEERSHFKSLLSECSRGKTFLLAKLEDYKAKVVFLESALEVSQGPMPKTSGEISYDSLKNLLKDKTKSLFLSDNSYRLIYYSSMKEFLEFDKTDREKWVKTYHDCDDFSYRLMGQASTPAWAGIAFGMAWSKSHAFNIFVSADRVVYLIEPQSDKIIKLSEAQGAYSDLQLVVI